MRVQLRPFVNETTPLPETSVISQAPSSLDYRLLLSLVAGGNFVVSGVHNISATRGLRLRRNAQ